MSGVQVEVVWALVVKVVSFARIERKSYHHSRKGIFQKSLFAVSV